MFGPDRAHLLVGRKLAARGGGFRGGDSGLLVWRERHRRFIVRAGELKNDTGDVVLRVRRKVARGFKRLIEKFCHEKISGINLYIPRLPQNPNTPPPLRISSGRIRLDCMIRAGFLDPESRKDLTELARDGSAAHRLARRANALVLLDDGMS